MSDNKKQLDPQELFKKINLKKLQGALFQAIASMLSGDEVKKEIVEIKLAIPKAIHDMVDEVCKTLDQDSYAVFTKMASDGFMNSLQEVLNMANSVDEEVKKDTPKKEDSFSEIPGIEMLSNKLGGIQELSKQLERIQKVFQDVQQNLPNDNS